MKLTKFLPVIFSCLFGSFLLYAQHPMDFFPLEIGNLWSYDVYDEGGNHYVSNMEVIGDTTLPGGKSYYVLSNYDAVLGPLVRVDSQFIYFVQVNDTAEMPLYKTAAQVGDSLNVNWGAYSFIYLTGIDSLTLFDSVTVMHTYALDGLQFSMIKFSKDFGPMLIEHYGDPPAPFPLWRQQLRGCILSGNVYGVVSSINDQEPPLPKGFVLQQNYPNPFNPKTAIQYELPVAAKIELTVYDLLGKQVKTLVNSRQAAGIYQVEFDGSELSSGVYLYRLEINHKGVLTRKMVLLK